MNFITRSDFNGAEARLGYGQSSRSDAKEKQAGIVAGFGKLETDRFNVLLGLDVFKRDPVYRKDRDISSSVDFRRLGSPRRTQHLLAVGQHRRPETRAAPSA